MASISSRASDLSDGVFIGSLFLGGRMPGRDHPEDFSKSILAILHDDRDEPPTERKAETLVQEVRSSAGADLDLPHGARLALRARLQGVVSQTTCDVILGQGFYIGQETGDGMRICLGDLVLGDDHGHLCHRRGH